MHYQKDREKLDRKNSYANHVINNLKDDKYSNNVQNHGNSDLFGSNLTHEQMIKTQYMEVELIMKVIFPHTVYDSEYDTDR